MTKWICSHCDGANREDALECRQCGNPFDESDTLISSTDHRAESERKSQQIDQLVNRLEAMTESSVTPIQEEYVHEEYVYKAPHPHNVKVANDFASFIPVVLIGTILVFAVCFCIVKYGG